MPLADSRVGTRILITVVGVVQGVGFRPFVCRLGRELGLAGDVRNNGGEVVVRAAGTDVTLTDFLTRLRNSGPPAALVERMTVAPLAADVSLPSRFAVAGSSTDLEALPRIPADLATCHACVRELFDPSDRRFRYPFINCTDCGPRATVIEAMPYDRERTTMRSFALCEKCVREYTDPADRRFRAEPTSCPECGPRLSWRRAEGSDDPTGEAALGAACAAIASGGIVAIKGIGGYQLVCDAASDEAVLRLRETKPRPTKPLAVMVGDLAAATELGVTGTGVSAALSCAAAPIVLLPRRLGAPVSAGIAPTSHEIGIFLPYSPLHHLMMAELRRPLVVTSGNRAGAPTVVDEGAAATALGPISDGILHHDRPIRARHDDSVVRVRAGRTTMVRRARGFAPSAVPLPVAASAPVLAVGAQLKHASAVAVRDRAVIGPHLGDLEDADTYSAFERTTTDLCDLHGVRPEVVAHDLHPGYLSTRYAHRHWPTDKRIAVQHHHAHVAATAAEHGVEDEFIGVALDGLGLGADGTLWGGEVMIADLLGYRRVGRFATAPLPGGAAAVRRPARMALGYVLGAEQFGGRGIPEAAATALLDRLSAREIAVTRGMLARNVNCPRASSAGRLFDAVAALLGICDDNSYEGEAAARLEAAAAAHSETEALRWAVRRRDGLLVYDPVPTLCHALELAGHHRAGVIAARFHLAVAEAVLAITEQTASASGLRVVCLGGGVFQNALLTDHVLSGLTALGLTGLVGERIPMNDGGICYGQAAVAAARMAGG